MKWWKSNPERFAIEKKLLAQFHPDVKIIIKNGKMRVLKQLWTHQNKYFIEGIFSDHHPYSAMRVYVREPHLKGSPPHKFPGNELCLHDDDGVGPETTAKIYMDWACQWIRIYEKWLDGKRWPKTNRGS